MSQFLLSSPKPLYLQYDSTDPNSITSWLDRWSVSNFWKAVSTKPGCSTLLDQNQSTQSVFTPETSRAKHNNKLPSAHVDNGSTPPFDFERSKGTFRKPTIHSVEISDPEAARSELEKVKRSLRKAHESAFPPAAEDDKHKPTQSSDNTFANSGQVPEQNKSVAAENKTEDSYDTLPTMVDVEASAEHSKPTETIDSMLSLQTSINTKPLDNATENDKLYTENEYSSVKQDMLDKENQKVNLKDSSQLKHESAQNSSSKQLKIPSYMLATKSAKAKLRDTSALFEQEVSEESHSTRRHSLSSVTGTKLTSLPNTQKLIPPNRKTKNKRDKSVTASKDGSGKHSDSTIRLHFSNTIYLPS